MSKPLIIYGTGEFAQLMWYFFTNESDYNVAGFCVDQKYLKVNELCGLPVYAFEQVTERFPPEDFNMFVAIGYSVMRLRSVMYGKALQQGYDLVNFISPKAIVRDDLVIGSNNAIFSSCDLEPAVRIGENNIFWTRCILGHGVVIGNHNYFSGGVGLGGRCIIGDYCFMGNAALMVNDISIADETFLVAGTVIIRDTEPSTRYHGNPARRVGTHKETGIIIK